MPGTAAQTTYSSEKNKSLLLDKSLAALHCSLSLPSLHYLCAWLSIVNVRDHWSSSGQKGQTVAVTSVLTRSLTFSDNQSFVNMSSSV